MDLSVTLWNQVAGAPAGQRWNNFSTKHNDLNRLRHITYVKTHIKNTTNTLIYSNNFIKPSLDVLEVARHQVILQTDTRENQAFILPSLFRLFFRVTKLLKSFL